MYSPEKPPRDPCHLLPTPIEEDPYRAGGIVEDFDDAETGPTLLLQGAARLGDIERMSMAIDAGASLSAKDSWGLAPIHSAALVGSTSGVGLLIESRASVDEISLRGQTALHLAAAEGKDDVLIHLLQAKADVALPTNFGSTAVAIAERRRRAAAIAAGEASSEPGRAEVAIREELARRLEYAEIEEAEKEKQYADAVAARENLEAQLGSMVTEIRSAMKAADEAAATQAAEEAAALEASKDVPPLGLNEKDAGDSTAPSEQVEAEPKRRPKAAPPKPKPKASPRTMETAVEILPPTPVGDGYEYWRTANSSLADARIKGEDALKRSWLRDLPLLEDEDIFPWTGQFDSLACLPMPDPEDDILVNGYEWLLQVAKEEEARTAALKQQAALMDSGESLVQRTRDMAMTARTGATQAEWESRVEELQANNCHWDWKHIEVRQRSVSSDSLAIAGVFAVGSPGEVVFDEWDVIGPLGGTIRRRSRYEELYYSGHDWNLHDPMSFQMSLHAQTADLKSERLVMDLRVGSSQNRLRYLSDFRPDPMGLCEKLGIGEMATSRSVLPARKRMPRPRSRPGSPESRDPSKSQAAASSSAQAERVANARWAEVLVDGWPHVFVVATGEIRAEEEILVDYGEDYWAAQRTLFSRFLDMGQLGDETVVRVNGVERDAHAYKESLSGAKEHWQWQRDRLAKEWK